MYNVTKTRLQLLLLLLCLLAPAWLSAQTPSLPLQPAQARDMAGAQLNKVLEWLDPAHLEQFGFDAKDDLSAISIGTPLYQAGFTDESVISGSKPAISTNLILIPLSLNGSTRCFLYIAPGEDGQWTVSGIGGNSEAKAWNRLFTGKTLDTRQDYISMLHIPQNNADYLWQRTDGKNAFTDVSVTFDPKETTGSPLSLDEVFLQAVTIAREARASGKDNTGY